jgi:hypothetical protein
MKPRFHAALARPFAIELREVVRIGVRLAVGTDPLDRPAPLEVVDDRVTLERMPARPMEGARLGETLLGAVERRVGAGRCDAPVGPRTGAAGRLVVLV